MTLKVDLLMLRKFTFCELINKFIYYLAIAPVNINPEYWKNPYNNNYNNRPQRPK
jgi:hypothetical protein